jgi:hypothetical protein
MQFALRNIFWGITLTATGLAALHAWLAGGDTSILLPVWGVTAGALAIFQRNLLWACSGFAVATMLAWLMFCLCQF